MKKIDNTNNQVLNLGSLHEQIQHEKEMKKIKGLPIILIILGMVLILLGIFFPKIQTLLKLNQTESKTTNEITTNQRDELTCTTSKSDKTIGITTKISNIYTFEQDLLKELKVVTTYTVIENNYDVGVSNLSLYNDKYLELENTFATIEGIKVSHNLEDNVLIATTIFELEKVDTTKIPQNNFISLSNTLNQEKKSIKEIEGKSGHICNES